MNSSIHPSAVVDTDATIGDDVRIGPFAVVGPAVVVGAESEIASHAILERNVRLGANCVVGAGAVVGSDPQDLKYRGEESWVEVGDGTKIREYVTVNRGTAARGTTRIGRDCFIMAYAHVAHDCEISDRAIIANAVQLGGHVVIGEGAVIGGSTPIHQFVNIGPYAFVGGGSRVPQDVPPFTRAAGNPMRLYGINRIGLERAGFDSATIERLKRAYRLLFNSKLTTSQALARLEAELDHPEIRLLTEFFRNSERGVLQTA